MPQVVPYVVGAFKAVAAGAATIWQSITVVSVKVAASLAVSYVASKITSSRYDAVQAMQGRMQNIRSTAQPRVTLYGKLRVGGQLAFVENTGTDNEYLWLVLVHAAHEVYAIDRYFINGEEVPMSGTSATGRFAGYFWAYPHLGTDSQAADANLVAASAGKWTANHRLRGCAYTVFKLKYSTEENVWPNGIPVLTAEIRGKKVWDFRTNTFGYSPNWALCVADYIMANRGASVADFSASEIAAAANLSDEVIAYHGVSGWANEARYELHAAIRADEDPEQVIDKMRAAGMGFISETGGFWTIHAGGWRAPDVTLTASDFHGPISVTTRQSIAEGGNGVRGVFSNGAENYVPMEFPAVTNATYLTEDNNVRRWIDLNFEYTTSSSMAQRLAKIALEEARQQISISAVLSNRGLRLRAGDVVMVTLAKFGWSAKAFEVHSLELVEAGDADAPALLVEVALRETASGVYDWVDGEETAVDLAPNTALRSAWYVGTPIWGPLESGTDHLAPKGDGTYLSRLWAPWTVSGDAFVSLFEIEYRTPAGPVATQSWTAVGTMPRGAAGLYLVDVIDGVSYELRIRAVNGLGVKSAWVESSAHVIVGKTAAPSTPTGFAAVALTEAVKLSWTEISDLDAMDYLVYVATSATKPGSAAQTVVGSSVTITDLPADVLHYFWLEARDTSKNVSAGFAGPVTATPDAKTVAVGEGALSASVTGYTFQARADGVVVESLDNGDSTIEVFLGSAAKSYNAAATNDAWRFGTVTAVNCTRDAGVAGPEVGISALAADSAYLEVEVIYRTAAGVDRPILAKVLFGKRRAAADMFASPVAVSLPASAAGVVSSFAAASWTPYVTWGGAAKTYAAAPTNDRWRYGTVTVTGCTQSVSLTAPEIGISALAADVGRLEAVVIYRDDQGVDHYASAVGTFSKALTGAIGSPGADGANGADGADGADGTNGTRIANGLVYLAAPQSATPATPSASVFNFSTGAFTGLTAGWQVVPVEVVINDTSTKYWQSRYNVSEATLGGTQTLTFAAPTGSVNFGSDVQSDNFVSGASGWRIRRADGAAEFGDLVARGSFESGSPNPSILGDYYTKINNSEALLETYLGRVKLESNNLSISGLNSGTVEGLSRIYGGSVALSNSLLSKNSSFSHTDLRFSDGAGGLLIFDVDGIQRTQFGSPWTSMVFNASSIVATSGGGNVTFEATNLKATSSVFFGADCELARQSANMLSTPDSLTVGGALAATGLLTAGAAVAGAHLDTAAVARGQGSDGSLQMVAADSGTSGARLTLTNGVKHWQVNNAPDDNRLEFRYGSTAGNGNVFSSTTAVVEFGSDGKIYSNGVEVGIVTQTDIGSLSLTAVTGAGTIGNAVSISSVAAMRGELLAYIAQLKSALDDAGIF